MKNSMYLAASNMLSSTDNSTLLGLAWVGFIAAIVFLAMLIYIGIKYDKCINELNAAKKSVDDLCDKNKVLTDENKSLQASLNFVKTAIEKEKEINATLKEEIQQLNKKVAEKEAKAKQAAKINNDEDSNKPVDSTKPAKKTYSKKSKKVEKVVDSQQ